MHSLSRPSLHCVCTYKLRCRYFWVFLASACTGDDGRPFHSSYQDILHSSSLAKAFHSLWWKPKQLERLLKQQGIHGSHYKLLFGDMLQLRTSITEAWSKPMDLNHRILPRGLHFYHHMFEKHGNHLFIIYKSHSD